MWTNSCGASREQAVHLSPVHASPVTLPSHRVALFGSMHPRARTRQSFQQLHKACFISFTCDTATQPIKLHLRNSHIADEG